jgi:hypothetical protein
MNAWQKSLAFAAAKSVYVKMMISSWYEGVGAFCLEN